MAKVKAGDVVGNDIINKLWRYHGDIMAISWGYHGEYHKNIIGNWNIMGSPGNITHNYTIRKGLWGLDFDRTTGKWADFAWRVVRNTSSDRACDQLKVDVRGYTSRLVKITSHGTKAGQKSNNSSFKPIISWVASRILEVIAISD